MELVAPAGPVYQAGTLSGNPVAMTAGLWALKRLSPKLYKDLAARGSMLAAGLAEAVKRIFHIFKILLMGMSRR